MGLRQGRSASGSCRSTSGPDAVDDSCTTSFENAHGTLFRELLYPWHPWCALYVAIHEAIGKSNDLVFRCTLSGSDASRSVKIPAWMFDRGAVGRRGLPPIHSSCGRSWCALSREAMPPRRRNGRVMRCHDAVCVLP